MSKTLSRVRLESGSDAYLVFDGRTREHFYKMDGMLIAHAATGLISYELLEELGPIGSVADFERLTGLLPVVFIDDCRRCGESEMMLVTSHEGLCVACRRAVAAGASQKGYVN